MKRVAEIDQELKQLKEKKFKLKQERSKQFRDIGEELCKKFPVVYCWYDTNDPDFFFPDLIFASREKAEDHQQKQTYETCVYAMASEEMPTRGMLKLVE